MEEMMRRHDSVKDTILVESTRPFCVEYTRQQIGLPSSWNDVEWTVMVYKIYDQDVVDMLYKSSELPRTVPASVAVTWITFRVQAFGVMYVCAFFFDVHACMVSADPFLLKACVFRNDIREEGPINTMKDILDNPRCIPVPYPWFGTRKRRTSPVELHKREAIFETKVQFMSQNKKQLAFVSALLYSAFVRLSMPYSLHVFASVAANLRAGLFKLKIADISDIFAIYGYSVSPIDRNSAFFPTGTSMARTMCKIPTLYWSRVSAGWMTPESNTTAFNNTASLPDDIHDRVVSAYIAAILRFEHMFDLDHMDLVNSRAATRNEECRKRLRLSATSVIRLEGCPVCLSDVEEHQTYAVMDCGHMLCMECAARIRHSGRISKSCPTCKQGNVLEIRSLDVGRGNDGESPEKKKRIRLLPASMCKTGFM
jgi:hypothetical protein